MTVLLQTEPAPEAPRETSAGRAFDGVICFGGGDWWYHNRGHYDLQMMRELGGRVPVLYVNSIGIRVPSLSEGGMFFHRVKRKLKSLARGFVRVSERFGVLSPAVLPGRYGARLSQAVAPVQIRAAARRMGIRRPLVWVTCPPGYRYLDALDPVGVVYERTDRWESFPEANTGEILELHRALQQRADLTLYCATLLFDEEKGSCRNAAYVDHGVDFDLFASAGRAGGGEPEDLSGLPRPRVGFVGAIDALTFDPRLFEEVARRLPDFHFVCIGSSTLPEERFALPNVSMLGQRPYESVASYMAACDVLVMPWNESEWITACNPVKLKEYLAVGRPVVTRPFHELCRYEGFVQVARDAEAFAGAIRQAAANPPEPERLRARVEGDTWKAKGEAVLNELSRVGVEPARS